MSWTTTVPRLHLTTTTENSSCSAGPENRIKRGGGGDKALASLHRPSAALSDHNPLIPHTQATESVTPHGGELVIRNPWFSKGWQMVLQRQRGDPGRLGGDERRYRGNPAAPGARVIDTLFLAAFTVVLLLTVPPPLPLYNNTSFVPARPLDNHPPINPSNKQGRSCAAAPTEHRHRSPLYYYFFFLLRFVFRSLLCHHRYIIIIIFR